MSYNPIISCYVEDNNAATVELTGAKSVLIRYHSLAWASMDISSQSGSPIDEDMCLIRNGSDVVYGTSGAFENVESGEFIFSVQDSAGVTYGRTYGVHLIEYQRLTCNIANNRPDASGAMTLACTGICFNGSFGLVNNEVTATYNYMSSGGDTGSGSMTVSYNGNAYYAYANLTGLDYQDAYLFTITAQDKLESVTASTSGVRSVPVFHWGESDFVFEVPVDVNGDLDVTGNVRLKGSKNYGNYLRFGDGDYCYIAEPTDDAMTIHASNLNLDTSNLMMGGLPCQGTWTPTLYSGAVSYYSAQSGWYSKIGSIVTVGFYIKATCNSGYEGGNVLISGLPYAPSYASAGGGMCSGAYVSSGFNFQCYVAEKASYISTRVQACNNTAASNLTTSASGCNYPYGGGELTLSGTITYMTT